MTGHSRDRFAVLAGLCLFGGLFVPAGATAWERRQAIQPESDAASQQAFTAARVDFRNQRYDEAIKGFKKAAAQKNGQCADCYTFMAQAYFRLGKLKDAANAQKQAIAVNPENDPQLYNQLGIYLYKEGDKKTLEEAVEAFQRAIDLSKGQVVIAYFNLGHALIKQGKEKEGIKALNSYLEADPRSSNASEARAIIANPRLATVGLAPVFRVRTTSGDDLALDQLKGRVVLLDFWATWCGPCREEMPAVKDIWKKYRGDQFVIVGISLDRDRGALNRYLGTEGISWPQVYDGDGFDSKLSRLTASGPFHTPS